MDHSNVFTTTVEIQVEHLNGNDDVVSMLCKQACLSCLHVQSLLRAHMVSQEARVGCHHAKIDAKEGHTTLSQ